MSSENAPTGGRHIDILLVDPDPGSATRFTAAFDAADTSTDVAMVSTGRTALEFVRRHGEFEDVSRPDLVLVSLEGRDSDAYDVVTAIKGDEELRRIPVIVVGLAENAADVACSYRDHANAYVPRPAELDAFDELVRAVEDFWLSSVRLPPKIDAPV